MGNEAVRLNPRNVDRIRGFGPPAVAAKLLVDAVDHPLNKKWWEYPPEYDPREGPRFPTVDRLRTEVLTEHSGYLRYVAGNPFRPVAFDPSWWTEAVVGLARGMYESRDFGPMPVLADALEDAGCADPDILSHCRTPGLHGRGCWVVDVILGKA